MSAEDRFRHIGGFKIDDRSIRKRSGNQALVIGLVAGGAVLLLFACMAGVRSTAVFDPYTESAPPAQWGGLPEEVRLPDEFAPRWEVGTQPDEFVGSWKGRFLLAGELRDVIYTFDKSGRFREEQFDLQGRRLSGSGLRWCFRDGHIQIEFHRGSLEKSVAVFVDDTTIDYRIVNHTDRSQIGLTTTFRRQ
jgi:hypothetical protein